MVWVVRHDVGELGVVRHGMGGETWYGCVRGIETWVF